MDLIPWSSLAPPREPGAPNAGASALRAFFERIEAGLAQPERAHALEREAARLGIAVETWVRLQHSSFGIGMLRDLHRGCIPAREIVRISRADGSWALAPFAAGELRDGPQSLRAADRVHVAFDPVEITTELEKLSAISEPTSAEHAVAHVAYVAWALSRIVPFTGSNERVLLAAVSRALRRVGLPALYSLEIERDRAFSNALSASTADDRSPLERYLSAAMWNEALSLAEWLGSMPGAEPPETLAKEHVRLSLARRQAKCFSPGGLEALADRAAHRLTSKLEELFSAPLGTQKRTWFESPNERFNAAFEAAQRGHFICPHEPILELRWALPEAFPLEARALLGAAGRGVTGGGSLALHVGAPGPRPDRPVLRPATLLVVMDETEASQSERLDTWADAAIAQAAGPWIGGR